MLAMGKIKEILQEDLKTMQSYIDLFQEVKMMKAQKLVIQETIKHLDY